MCIRDRYINGNVVSAHAQRLITNYFTATLARTTADDDSTDEEADLKFEDDVHPLCPSLDELHDVLRGQACLEGDVGRLSSARRKHMRAISRGRSMWTSLPQHASGTDAIDTSGDRPCMRVQEYGKAARAAGKEQEAAAMPYAGKTAPLAVIHGLGSMGDIDRWLRHLQSDRFVGLSTAGIRTRRALVLSRACACVIFCVCIDVCVCV